MMSAYSTVSSVINSIVTLTGEHVITKIWKNMPDSTYLLITKLLGEIESVVPVIVERLFKVVKVIKVKA